MAETAKEVVRRLHTASSHDEALAAARWGLNEIDGAYASTPARFKATVACRAGCDFCCHIPLGVQAHEVFIAAVYIQRHFSPEDLAATIQRAGYHRVRVLGCSAAESLAIDQPCPLLVDHRCSIYSARPEVCRTHHTRDSSVCEAAVAHPEVPMGAVLIPELRNRVFSVMVGIDQAFADAGFDGRAYDFGSALHQALTDDQCIIRWGQRQIAFHDSCREPEQIEGHGPGEFRPGQLRF